MSAGIDCLSIVVPVYRGAGTLRELVQRVSAVVQQLGARTEIVLVDDCSPDNSWAVISELEQEHPGVVVGIQLMRNSGQHNAIMCGLRHAQGEFIITMDDDLQNPPEEIPRLLEEIQTAGADVVYGIPEERRDPSWRRLGSEAIQLFVQRVIGMPGPVSAFRVLRRPVVDAILRYNLNYTFIDGLLSWNTQRFHFVRVEHCARKLGRSGYSMRRLVLHALNIATNFSLLPLQIASGVGLAASVIGLLAGTYYLIRALTSTIAVPGYASIIVAVMVLGGLQLLALGIIGEYVGRLHLNVNRKPQYTVRHVLGRGAPTVEDRHPTVPDVDQVAKTVAEEVRV